MGSSIKHQDVALREGVPWQVGKVSVAKVKIPKGTALTLGMLGVKVAEPMGIPAGDIFQLVGKTMTQDVEEVESVLQYMVNN
ncbi:hypothetical protein CHARACLAT_019757 [Characodon lateralis]|uniref:Ice-structuring protein n=1 Tax=Characodon lateralis TaxID=208331 RepID=A0ABU7EWA5_9TELE|nr:hypothetical protein [Characodon lateralis]